MLKTLVTAVGLSLALAACSSAPVRQASPIAALVAKPAGTCAAAETASRIPAQPNTCDGFGASYTQDDLQRTGGRDAAHALKLLDPSISIHLH